MAHRGPSFLLVVLLAAALPRAAAADLNTVPTAWSNFPQWYPLTFGGLPARDFENTGGCTDPTKGPANFTAEVDIASGGPPYDVANCNPAVAGGTCCGTATSAFWSYFNGGGPIDPDLSNDYLALRMRVNGDPRDSSGNCLSPSHWNFLHDWDGDGFKEWWYDAWGNENEVRLLFEDAASQQVSNDNPAPSPGTLINLLTACAVKAPATATTTCGPASARRDCFYSHSRVCGVPAAPADLTNPAVCSPTTDATGEWFVEVQVPINLLRSNLPPAQCCNPIVLGPQVLTTFPPPIHLFFSTSDSTTNPVQKDFIADCQTSNGPCSFSDPTPVSLASFRAERTGTGVAFDWTTASESGNVGFDLLVEDKGGWRKVNARPVPSRKAFALEPNVYHLEIPGVTGERFALEEIDLFGEHRRHGPFAIETSYGTHPQVSRLNWRQVNAEHTAKVVARVAARRTAARAASSGIGAASVAPPSADLRVDADGVYRVTGRQLAQAGMDFTGANAADLALTLDGRPVPVRVGGPARFGTQSFVEFVGRAASGDYTRTNVYRLTLDRARAARVRPLSGAGAADAGGNPATTYPAELRINRDLEWTFARAGDDPWYADWIVAFAGEPVVRNYTFDVDHLVAGAGPAALLLELWGMTDWPQAPDHHVRIALNGSELADETFDGLRDLRREIPLPADLLVEGTNTLTLTLPIDHGVSFEVEALDSFGARYPRSLIASDGRLDFHSPANDFRVDGLAVSPIFAYEVSGQTTWFLRPYEVSKSPAGLAASFRAVQAADDAVPEFFVTQGSVVRAPEVRPPRRAPALRPTAAQYLVIAHPDFVRGLAPLLAARRAEGLTVAVADVEDVYAEFGHGRFGPQAIRDYIRFAASRLGTRMVLLVGADSYDYLDHGGTGSFSFLPTIYAETGPIVKRAPADALYGDVDGDGVPDLPVGRFPVHDDAELDALVHKTLAYPAAAAAGRAVFAADSADTGADFRAAAEEAAGELGDGWQIQRAYLDDVDLASARSILLGALDDGVAYAQFSGHSSPDVWTFDGLFGRSDAAALANQGRPAVVVPLGCWNAFYVTPSAQTLADSLLTAGEQGAAAVAGPSALADADADRAMGRLLAREFVAGGARLGDAILSARRTVAAERPWMKDVVRAFNLLGDPALRVAP
jgi:hypothetical protein